MAKAVKKKKWFKIKAPKLFKETIAGETPALDEKTVVGKTLKVNMFTLTDNMRKQNTEVSLIVDKVEGEHAKTSLIGYRMIPTSVKRMVRKGRTRLDQTIKAPTKDEKIITIKILLVTRNVVQSLVSRGLQKELKRLMIKKISNSTFDELAEQVVFIKLQRELKEKLAKIYPLRTCEVKMLKLERFVKAVDERKIKASVKKVDTSDPEPAQEVVEKAQEAPQEKAES